MSQLLAVLNKLLDVLLAVKRSMDQKKAQKERDELEDNPAGWFTKHFSGRVPTVPTEGSDGNKADTGGNS